MRRIGTIGPGLAARGNALRANEQIRFLATPATISSLARSFARDHVGFYNDHASNPTVDSVAANTLRDTHYVNGERTWLLENSSENIAGNSNSFGISPWGGGTVTANDETAPDGTATADRVVLANGGDTISQFASDGASAGGRSWIASVWLKKVIASSDDGLEMKCSHAGVADHFSSLIVPTTDWMRYSFAVTLPGGGGSNLIVGWRNATTKGNASEVFAWGFQVEEIAGAASTNIATVATDVTREADDLVVWHRAGTLYQRYEDLSSPGSFTDSVSVATRGLNTLTHGRAYTHYAVLRPGVSLSEARTLLGI